MNQKSKERLFSVAFLFAVSCWIVGVAKPVARGESCAHLRAQLNARSFESRPLVQPVTATAQALDAAAARQVARGLNARSLNAKDIAQLLAAAAENRPDLGIDRSGSSNVTLANYIGYDDKGRWIAATELPIAYLENISGNSANAISFRVRPSRAGANDGLLPGQHQDRDACREAARDLPGNRRAWVDQQYHTAVNGTIPLRVVETLTLNGKIYSPSELLGRVAKLNNIIRTEHPDVFILHTDDFSTSVEVSSAQLAAVNPRLARRLADPGFSAASDVLFFVLNGDSAWPEIVWIGLPGET